MYAKDCIHLGIEELEGDEFMGEETGSVVGAQFTFEKVATGCVVGGIVSSASSPNNDVRGLSDASIKLGTPSNASPGKVFNVEEVVTGCLVGGIVSSMSAPQNGAGGLSNNIRQSRYVQHITHSPAK